MGGYVGKIAVVDLTTGEVTARCLSGDECRRWLGGGGLGAKILMDESSAEMEPLSPENPLIFMTGPMTGTNIPGSGRHQVITKSPLTGIYGEADAGGKWGTLLKRAGFDGIVIKGKAQKPVYLFVHDEQIDIIDAQKVWGLDTYQTDHYLKSCHGPDIAVSCIGPAGEKMVRIATIMHEGKVGRSSGRGGLGAVMGSKNLKAVVATGQRPITVADPVGLQYAIESMAAMIADKTDSMQRFGTAGSIIGSERIGDLPLKNWSQGTWSEVDKISGQVMAETMVTGRHHCQSCSVGCGRTVKVPKGTYGQVDGAGPEYETLGMFGGSCLISDLNAIAYANELCNRYGIDTISTGATIAFAMELYENGLLREGDFAGEFGIPQSCLPVWGNAKALIWLIERIGRQEGIGLLLGNGVRHAAAAIGGKAPDYALHVKGLEMPAHDPRASYSLGLGYATSNRGACHLQGGSLFFEKVATLPEIGIQETLDRFRLDNQGLVQARLQDTMCLMDSLKLCKFLFYGGINLTIITEWLHHLTGWDCSVEELLTTGERIFNLKRLYNVRCGVSRCDDSLPERILLQPRPDGGAAGNLPPLADMLTDYYHVRGWNQEGCPTPATLARLDIDG